MAVGPMGRWGAWDGGLWRRLQVDSKTKAAFTRKYNQGVHKSQALGAAQAVGKKRKARCVSSPHPPSLQRARPLGQLQALV